ncbi:hypothetical protein JTB14_019105 [Gonioctena quinquepunctata]|nr:hypothetical protein JTB14_019105 [Gonioctena quinquepunctata]
MDESKNSLDKVDWSIYYNQENSYHNVLMNTLTQTHQSPITKHFPLEKDEEQNKPRVEWINQELRQMRETISRNNLGRAITQYQISKLLGEVFSRATVPITAINAKFLAAEVSDNPINDGNNDEGLNVGGNEANRINAMEIHEDVQTAIYDEANRSPSGRDFVEERATPYPAVKI